MRLRAADKQQGARLPQCLERVEVIEAWGMLVDEGLTSELPRLWNHARFGTCRLIAGSEEVEADAIGKRWIALNQRTRGGKDRAQCSHAERKQRAGVADVDTAVVRDKGAGLPACDRIQICRIPPNRNLRRHVRRDTGPHKRVLICPGRYRSNRIGGLQHTRLQMPGKRTCRPAFRVNGAAIATANLTAPRADPGVLVIEDERDIETAFEHRPEHRRIGWIERDEERIEGTGAMKRPRGAAKAGKRT